MNVNKLKNLEHVFLQKYPDLPVSIVRLFRKRRQTFRLDCGSLDKFRDVNLNPTEKRNVHPDTDISTRFARILDHGSAAFPATRQGRGSRGDGGGYCSLSVHDKVAACVLSMSTRWNLQMYTDLWLVDAAAALLYVFYMCRAYPYRKNIVSTVLCASAWRRATKIYDTDAIYHRDNFETEHPPFRSHRFPPCSFRVSSRAWAASPPSFAIASRLTIEPEFTREPRGKSCSYD